MKNIAIIVPTLNKGGAERMAANMSLEFAKYYNVFVIVHDGRNIIYPYDGQLIDLHMPPATTKLGKITTLIKRILAVKKIKKQYKIDIAISHLPPSNYVNVLSRSGEKVFTYVHCMEKANLSNRLREFLTTTLSTKVICVSACVRQNMITNFHVNCQKATTIYNFCNLIPPPPAPPHGSLSILTVGRLEEPKGQWHLIRAMKKVIDTLGPNITLTIVGEGSKRQSLELLSKQLGMQEQIRFTGFLQNPWEQSNTADIYVSSSLWEGLPMALIEATRCGLPIIATDCDAGCREILAPDTDIKKKTTSIEQAAYGILVPVCFAGDELQCTLTKEESILADAIIKLIQDNDLRGHYAKKAKERSEYFTAENIMKQWKQLLGSI